MENYIVKKPVLYLFTNEFPYGNAEAYLESEIPLLIDIFSKVYIVPSKVVGLNRIKNMPENFEIIFLNQNWSHERGRIFLSNFSLILKTIANEFFFTEYKIAFLKKIKLYKNVLIHKLHLGEQLVTIINTTNEKSVFCSYWFSDWATVLGLLKCKRNIDNFFSRGHGFDVFDDRNSIPYFPFRYLQLSKVTCVYSVSKIGAEYLKKKNVNKGNISVSYLGVEDRGWNNFSNDNIFTIVSCSNVTPLKRVEMIVEILSHLDFPLKWIHFGDGDRLPEVTNMCKNLPKNINFDLRGRVPNAEILKFYSVNSVNLFLTTSSMEALPMTLIEAASFGIPLMGINVGGVSEIINEQTGILIPEFYKPKDIASEIILFRIGNKNSQMFREGVKMFWKNNFDAKVNYSRFYNEIIQNNQMK